jgi:hypothetical protein
MQTSYFLARLIGPFCLALGLGVLASGANYRALVEEFLNSRALVFLAGLISLPTGLAIVLTHNVWVLAWPVIITILGWLLVIGGTTRLVIPQQAAAVARTFVARPGHQMLAVAIWFALGATLSFFGYIQTT